MITARILRCVTSDNVRDKIAPCILESLNIYIPEGRFLMARCSYDNLTITGDSWDKCAIKEPDFCPIVGNKIST